MKCGDIKFRMEVDTTKFIKSMNRTILILEDWKRPVNRLNHNMFILQCQREQMKQPAVPFWQWVVLAFGLLTILLLAFSAV